MTVNNPVRRDQLFICYSFREHDLAKDLSGRAGDLVIEAAIYRKDGDPLAKPAMQATTYISQDRITDGGLTVDGAASVISIMEERISVDLSEINDAPLPGGASWGEPDAELLAMRKSLGVS